MVSVMNLSGYIVVGHHHEQADVFTVISLHIVGMYALVLVIGEFIDRIGRRVCLISGLAIMALSTVMLAWVESILGTSVSLFLLGLGWNLSYVAASAELVTHATPVERGRLVGFTDLAAGLLAAALAARRCGLHGVGRRRDRRRRDRGGRRPGARAPCRPAASRRGTRARELTSEGRLAAPLPFVFVLMLWCTRET